MHEKARDQLDHPYADDVENKLVTAWGTVKTNLGVEDEDLAEVEAEVRGNVVGASCSRSASCAMELEAPATIV